MKAQLQELWRIKWRIVLPVAIVGGAVLVTSYLMDTQPQAQRAARPEAQARLVDVTTVRRGEYPITVTANGAVMPTREVQLAAQVGGEIVWKSDKLVPGGQFEKGERILQIEPRDYELAVDRAESALATAEANLNIERGSQTVAAQEYEFLGEDLPEAEQALVLRQPQLKTAQADVAAARANLEEAKLALARTTVRAPFDALVLSEDVDVGTQLSTSATIARLAGTGSYWVQLSLPSSTLRWLSTGAKADDRRAKVTLYNDGVWGPNVSRTGHLVRVLGDLSAEGRMARVLVSIPDPLAREPDHAEAPTVLIGSYLRAEVEGRTLQDVVALDRALVRDGDIVWVMNAENALEIRTVDVLYASQSEVLISDGLEDGERVVITDIPTAAPGMPLRVSEPTGEVLGGYEDEYDQEA